MCAWRHAYLSIRDSLNNNNDDDADDADNNIEVPSIIKHEIGYLCKKL
jgi:hypothetical protein